MEPSAKSPNVLLFTSSAGQKYGYVFDGWHPDGTFHYTGEGPSGDQRLREGNRATRFHIADGRALRLFKKEGTSVRYIGEFEVPDESHLIIDEANGEDGLPRKVFVFRLKPVGDVAQEAGLPTAPPFTLASEIPLEAMNVEQYVAERASTEPTTALRTEAKLVSRYVDHLTNVGKSTSRHKVPTPAGHVMYTDIYVKDDLDLIEAKASSSRQHVRVGLGQILDYARYVDHKTLALLVPTRPEPEMIALLIAHGIGCIWETESKTFDELRPADAWDASDSGAQ
jgi:hypothetical protein